jgi:hypothetical protein
MKKDYISHSRIILGERYNVQLGKNQIIRGWNNHVDYCKHNGLSVGTFITFVKTGMYMYFTSKQKELISKIIYNRIEHYRKNIIEEYSNELGYDCTAIINRKILRH